MDLTGQKYGRLTVIEKSETHVTPKGRNVYMWRCVCDCGKESIVSTSALRSGQSCLRSNPSGDYGAEVHRQPERE